MKREGKFTKCDRGLTSHEVPSAPSGVCSSWKKLERFFSFSPVFLLEHETHQARDRTALWDPSPDMGVSTREVQQEPHKAGLSQMPSMYQAWCETFIQVTLFNPTNASVGTLLRLQVSKQRPKVVKGGV